MSENKLEAALETLAETGVAPEAPHATLAEQDPVEVAAMLINQYSARYKKAIYDLTTGDARRLNVALCTYPLENEHIMDGNDKLHQAYQLGCYLMEAKFILLNEAMTKKIQEQIENDKLNAEQTKEETQNG